MIISLIVGLLSGVAASMGLGGGFVFLLYLTVIANVEQVQAQGMNLIFFLPIAVLSIIMHMKNGLIEKKPILPAIIFGALGVGIGAFFAFLFEAYWLSKIFAVFILGLGIKELFAKKKNKSLSNNDG